MNLLDIKTFYLLDVFKERIYNMYVSSYSATGIKVWFSTPKDLFDCYTDVLIKSEEKSLVDTEKLEYCILYRHFSKRKKMSIIMHNGSKEAKRHLMDCVADLVRNDEWMFECTVIPSKILQTRFNIQPIKDLSTIKEILEADKNKYTIVLNTTDDKSYTYTRMIIDQNGNVYENKENLYAKL